jgi:salicylate hydroxylase
MTLELPPILGETSVLIAGAGIGGLASALMLARKGIACTVLEKRTVLDEVGAGLQLSPNVTRLLIDIGLGPDIARDACEPERVVIRSLKSGAILGEVALGNDSAQRHQAPYWLTARDDLHMVLLDAVRLMPNIKLQIGSQITEARSFPDAVAAVMRRQGGTVDDTLTPLLVGADGVWSNTRRFMGDLRKPQFQKALAWRAMVRMEHVPATARLNEVCLWIGENRHVVHYPVKSGTMLNIVVVTRENTPITHDDDFGWSEDGSMDVLATRMRDAAFALREILAVPPAWRIWPLYNLPAHRMHSGRIALVGDAAHPVLPFQAQGAAMAIEDAACLAEVISAEPDDVVHSLKAYERLRLKRIQKVQNVSRRNGMWFHASMPLALVRNSVLAMRNRHDMLKKLDWLYSWRLTMQ